ncbi:flagellar biosynthesis protein FliQ [Marasmitruncus massiliensis]|jgi:flagellar biosynthetic protein FliQ|uniref:flagellar biosynthesis protein FliQ n=1 Tax=Marasmitruncus massiliensis TaxID=1944642 RepID=UPI000C7BB5D3|nr:flagellar biosynthesis protein FliQ [Marasmitruncus massiliensis]MBE6906542.1 flagellar biosynthesis protein FliQ [Oscillospiraceae bacterium]
MTQGEVLGVFQEAMLVAIKLASPLLVVSIVVGLIIAIFQAATQIHEQTLTFVPKILVIALMLIGLGSWMIAILTDFVNQLFTMMATI